MKTLMLALFVLITAIARLNGQASEGRPSPVATVQTCVKGIEIGDVDLIVSTFSEDAIVFFPSVSATRVSGKPGIRETFTKLFGGSGGAGKITPKDIVVQELGDVAIVTAHLRDLPALPILTPTVFPRRTFVLRYIEGRWLIVHLHASNFQILPTVAPKPESK